MSDQRRVETASGVSSDVSGGISSAVELRRLHRAIFVILGSCFVSFYGLVVARFVVPFELLAVALRTLWP